MRTGNILSLALVLFLFVGAIFCDFVLASGYRKIDLDDPYKNFSNVPAKPFKTLSIIGGNGYAIQIRKEENFSVKLLNSRKSFFTIRYSGDTAYVTFLVANQTYQSPESCITGLIISAPRLTACTLKGINTILSGFDTETMVLKAGSAAQVRMKKIEVQQLQIFADGSSVLDFQQNNRADLLVLNLKQKASITLNDIRFDKLEQTLSDSANVRLYPNGLNAILKYVDPVSPVRGGEK